MGSTRKGKKIMDENVNSNGSLNSTENMGEVKTDSDSSTQAQAAADNADATGSSVQNDSSSIEKLIQSAVDRATNKLGNENKSLRKQLDELVKKQLTDEERVELERKQERESFEQEKAQFLEEKHRLFAINKLSEADIKVTSDKLPGLVSLVTGGDEETISQNVKALSDVINLIVAAKVEETFKENGRSPSGAGGDGGQKENKNKGEIFAEKLGKERVEQEKKARAILDKFTGR